MATTVGESGLRQRRAAAPTCNNDETVRSTGPDPMEPWAKALLITVVLAPFAMFAMLKLMAPEVDHAQMWTRPPTSHSYSPEEIRGHLQNHTLVHIGGVHRSGTTLVWEALRRHDQAAPLQHHEDRDHRATPWLKAVFHEGIFLQGVYPRFGLDHRKFLLRKWASQFLRKIPYVDDLFPWLRLRMGVGRFALHPNHHITESSGLVNENNQQRLFNDWALYWDLDLPVLLEKSPSNLVISPFLHALWGLGLPHSPAKFIFVQRHPIAVALATIKAGGPTVSDLSISDLVENWLAAEEVLATDLRQYFEMMSEGGGEEEKPWRIIQIEDFWQDPRKVLTGLLQFVGLPLNEEVLAQAEQAVQKDPNLKYFQRFCHKLATNKEVQKDYTDLVRRFHDRILKVSSYEMADAVELCHDMVRNITAGMNSPSGRES